MAQAAKKATEQGWYYTDYYLILHNVEFSYGIMRPM